MSYLEIDSESIEKVIEYYSHYEFLPPTVLQENSSDLLLLKILPPWDLAFVNDLSDEVLNKLIHCCVRLEITPLLDLLCLSIAARFRDCKETAKQLRLNFDAYEAVESQIYLKNKYAWASN